MPPAGTELRRAALELKLAQAKDKLEAARPGTANEPSADEQSAAIAAALEVLGRTAAEDEAEYLRRVE